MICNGNVDGIEIGVDRIEKFFKGRGIFLGTIKSFSHSCYTVVYDEGGEEDFTFEDIKRYLIRVIEIQDSGKKGDNVPDAEPNVTKGVANTASTKPTAKSTVACNNCRKSKKKCDRKIPQCGNCRKTTKIKCQYASAQHRRLKFRSDKQKGYGPERKVYSNLPCYRCESKKRWCSRDQPRCSACAAGSRPCMYPDDAKTTPIAPPPLAITSASAYTVLHKESKSHPGTQFSTLCCLECAESEKFCSCEWPVCSRCRRHSIICEYPSDAEETTVPPKRRDIKRLELVALGKKYNKKKGYDKFSTRPCLGCSNIKEHCDREWPRCQRCKETSNSCEYPSDSEVKTGVLLEGRTDRNCVACAKRHSRCSREMPSCSYCVKHFIQCNYPLKRVKIAMNQIPSKDRKQRALNKILKFSESLPPLDFEGLEEDPSEDSESQSKIMTRWCLTCLEMQQKCSRERSGCDYCVKNRKPCKYPCDAEEKYMDPEIFSPEYKLKKEEKRRRRLLRYRNQVLERKLRLQQTKFSNRSCLGCSNIKEHCDRHWPQCQRCRETSNLCEYPSDSEVKAGEVPSKTIKVPCPFCSKIVCKQGLSSHQLRCPQNPQEQAKAPCTFCKLQFLAVNLPLHQTYCKDNPDREIQLLKRHSKRKRKEGLEKHQRSGRKTLYSSHGCVDCASRHRRCDRGYPTCEVCNELEMECHYPENAITIDNVEGKKETCTFCKKVVKFKGLRNHTIYCAKNPNRRTQEAEVVCPFCKELVNIKAMPHHKVYCKSNPDREAQILKRLEARTRKRKAVQKSCCPFCSGLVNVKALGRHNVFCGCNKDREAQVALGKSLLEYVHATYKRLHPDMKTRIRRRLEMCGQVTALPRRAQELSTAQTISLLKTVAEKRQAASAGSSQYHTRQYQMGQPPPRGNLFIPVGSQLQEDIILGKTKVQKTFSLGILTGVVTALNRGFYTVTYENGKTEEMNFNEVKQYMSSHTQYQVAEEQEDGEEKLSVPTPQDIILGRTAVQKTFPLGTFTGVVTALDRGFYTVYYENGKTEEMNFNQLKQYMSSHTQNQVTEEQKDGEKEPSFTKGPAEISVPTPQDIILGKTKVQKTFSLGILTGVVTALDRGFYAVTYENGQTEEMKFNQLKQYMSSHTQSQAAEEQEDGEKEPSFTKGPAEISVPTPQGIILGKTKVQKAFTTGTFTGVVTAYNRRFFTVTYEDGKTEKLNFYQLKQHMSSHTQKQVGLVAEEQEDEDVELLFTVGPAEISVPNPQPKPKRGRPGKEGEKVKPLEEKVKPPKEKRGRGRPRKYPRPQVTEDLFAVEEKVDGDESMFPCLPEDQLDSLNAFEEVGITVEMPPSESLGLEIGWKIEKSGTTEETVYIISIDQNHASQEVQRKFKEGDILTWINETKVVHFYELAKILQEAKAGQMLKLKILRKRTDDFEENPEARMLDV